MTTSLNTLFSTANRLLAEGKEFALVSVVRVEAPTATQVGDKALVTADGQFEGWIGGGCAQPVVLRTVRDALLDGKARMIRITPATETAQKDLGDILEFGMSCHSGGTIELFIDPVLPQAHLVIFGDSPVAVALCGLAPRVGFQVSVVAHEASAARFKDASRVLATDDLATVRNAIPSGASVVVATQGRRDLPCLNAALAVGARQTYFVASSRKAGVLKESLIQSGHDRQTVEAIVAPAGQAIGAQTPEEIALAVLAAVVSAKRQNRANISPEPAAAAVITEGTPAVVPAKRGSCCGGGSKVVQNAASDSDKASLED